MRKPYLYIVLLFVSCHSTGRYPPGGYRYPEHLSAKDTLFYFYPLKTRESRRDSFRDAGSGDFFQSIHEPNLSIRPQASPVFRFVYDPSFGWPIIISLMPDRIIVKKILSKTDECMLLPDTGRLSPLERLHFRILEHNFPLEKPAHSARRQHYLDSMIRLYPVLLDVSYYATLQSKAYAHQSPCFAYTEKQIKISRLKFDSLVEQINASGYWQLPFDIRCNEAPFDGDGYIMEANTPSQYNVVSSSSCDDTGRYRSAWQGLIAAAGMDSLINICPVIKTDTASHPHPFVIQDVQLEDVPPAPRKKHRH